MIPIKNVGDVITYKKSVGEVKTGVVNQVFGL